MFYVHLTQENHFIFLGCNQRNFISDKIEPTYTYQEKLTLEPSSSFGQSNSWSDLGVFKPW